MKAVSPLLAGVLMIAFVLAVAAIVGGWLTSITKTETAIVETGLVTTVNCSKGALSIVYMRCGQGVTADYDQLNMTIANIGRITLTDFSLSGEVATGGIFANSSTYSKTLGLGGMTTLVYNFTHTSYSGVVEKVRVSAHSCPSVWAERIDQTISCP